MLCSTYTSHEDVYMSDTCLGKLNPELSEASETIRSDECFGSGSGIHLSGPPPISLQSRTFKSCGGSWTYPQKHLINCTTSNKLRRILCECCYKKPSVVIWLFALSCDMSRDCSQHRIRWF
ncbi:hypothetical protein MtrunA17_Chr6g0480131 [Medicago truncatula]|uniref:Uncharacterized protein n=1 Tax=Medicago truncatula TaxID=3880 RepID=G7KJ33_MEDTR|nr:hypothetical protein MTR_6g074160 [Medicago truncatula]RHN52403.1 hypothetical protein MtrunA17_Chr6g0480131 [Medicago truncatula]